MRADVTQTDRQTHRREDRNTSHLSRRRSKTEQMRARRVLSLYVQRRTMAYVTSRTRVMTSPVLQRAITAGKAERRLLMWEGNAPPIK